MARFGATQNDSVKVIEAILHLIVTEAVAEPQEQEMEKEDKEKQHYVPARDSGGDELPLPEITAAEILANLGEAALNDIANSFGLPIGEKQSEKAPEEYDPLDAAVRSIMDDGMFNIKRSPMKKPLIPSPAREQHPLFPGGDDPRIIRLSRTSPASAKALFRLAGQGPHSDITRTIPSNQTVSPSKGISTLVPERKPTTSTDHNIASNNFPSAPSLLPPNGSSALNSSPSKSTSMIGSNPTSVATSSPTMLLSSSGIALHPAARLGASTGSSDAQSATESSPITTAKANTLTAAQPESDNTNESNIRRCNALTESITPVNKSSPVVLSLIHI